MTPNVPLFLMGLYSSAFQEALTSLTIVRVLFLTLHFLFHAMAMLQTQVAPAGLSPPR